MVHLLFAAFSSVLSTTQSTVTKLASRNVKNISSMKFNTIKLGAAFVLFTLMSLGNLHFHAPTAGFAVCYSLAFWGSSLCGYLALTSGSMALTSLIVSYSVVIPCLHGMIFLGEKMTLVQVCGLAVMLVSMYLIMHCKDSARINKKWLMYVFLTFACNGICSVVQKLHQTAYPKSYCNEFMVYSLLVCTVLFGVFSVFKRADGGRCAPGYAVVSGVLMGLANYITLLLSANVNSTVLFPVVSVCSTIFIVTASRLVFKDKLTFVRLAGICLGVVSVLMIK